MHAPRDSHWFLVKRIIHYICGTMSLGLTLTASASTDLVAYSDADWADCSDMRRSMSGYCIYLGPSLIYWSLKRQPMVSRSSAEAEYRVVANAVAECSWSSRSCFVMFIRPLLSTAITSVRSTFSPTRCTMDV